MDREGVGGLLESILAVMAVITASSVFLVVLALGGIQVDEGIFEKDITSWLAVNGLISDTDAVEMDRLGQIFEPLGLPEEASGITLVYRESGNLTPLRSLNKGTIPAGDVLAFQLPLLIEVDGRNIPGVVEVQTWS
jgi:hypothetical protein